MKVNLQKEGFVQSYQFWAISWLFGKMCLAKIQSECKLAWSENPEALPQENSIGKKHIR